jgi:hypothetical protein
MNVAWPNNFTKGMACGLLAALLIGLLMGAVHHDGPGLPVAVLDPNADRSVPLSSTGRYQIAAWEGGGGYGAFVLDTATGTAKIAYSSVKGPSGKSVNNLGKPFHQM